MNCRTVDDAYQAGCDDGATDPPLTEQQVIKVTLLRTQQPAKDAA